MKSILAPAYTQWCEVDFRNYLEQFNLNPKQKIKTLSKGMKSKYALALALSHNAEILIMDEPTTGLDPLVRSQMMKILKDFMDRGGKGVLFSTHILSDLDKAADTLIMIDRGKIVFQEEKDSLLERYRIVKGDVGKLDSDPQRLFMQIETSPFSFTGLTEKIAEVKRIMPDAVIERATLEDIMLANVKGVK